MISGFRSTRSANDQIFYIHQILEKKWEYKGTVRQIFIDIEKSHDSTGREVPYVLTEFGSPMNLSNDKQSFHCALIEHHAMKAPRILDLGSRWKCSASRTGSFTPRERAPGTHWIRDWLGSRAGLDTVVKRKIPSRCRDSNSR
jgi:hypothetical protein